MIDAASAVLKRLAPVAIIAAGVTGAAFAQNSATNAKPQRIVSLNLCTDELLVRLVEPERIASVTFLSQGPGAVALELEPVMAKLKPNRGLAEEVLALKPDLVLVGAYSARHTTQMLQRLGVRYVAFEPDTNLDTVRANMLRVGEAVGEPERAAAMVASFDKRLAELKARIPDGPPPVYAGLGVNNWMAGPNTLAGAIVQTAGFVTLGETLGQNSYAHVPLEALAQTNPDVISTPTQWIDAPSLATQALDHPALRAAMKDAVRISIPDRLWTCGSPESLDAVETLVEARRRLNDKRAPS